MDRSGSIGCIGVDSGSDAIAPMTLMATRAQRIASRMIMGYYLQLEMMNQAAAPMIIPMRKAPGSKVMVVSSSGTEGEGASCGIVSVELYA